MQSIARLLWISAAATACGRVNFEARLGEEVDAAPGLAVVPPKIEFEARCGAASGEAAVVEIENAGESELSLAAATTSGGFAVVTALPIAIRPGARAQVEVRAPAAVIGTDRPGALKTGELMLDFGDGIQSVELVATVTGAELSVTDMNGELISLDLVGASGACPTPAPTQLINTGNTAASVLVSASSGFAIAGFSGGALDPGAVGNFTVRARTTGACSGVGTITFTPTGDVCSATPTVLQATFAISGSSSCSCS